MNSYLVCWLSFSVGGLVVYVFSGNLEAFLTGMLFTGAALFSHWLSCGRHKDA